MEHIITDSRNSQNGTGPSPDLPPATLSIQPAAVEEIHRSLEQYAPGGSAADTPVVRTVDGTGLVVIARGELGAVEVYRELDDTLLTLSGALLAAPIPDPQRRTALLTRSLVAVETRRRDAASELQQARDRHNRMLATVRGYVIERHRAGDIDRDVLDRALAEFDLAAYRPRYRVEFTITGSYLTENVEEPEARRQAETQIGADLDRITDIADDSGDYTVHIGAVERLDD